MQLLPSQQQREGNHLTTLREVTSNPVSRIGIAIAGASCSGKTTLANAVASELGATLLRIDDYYHPLSHLTYEQRCETNFDEPAAIDHELLVEHTRQMLNGQAVQAPAYDFTCHNRRPTPHWIEAGPVVIVEGLFALAYPELQSLCDLKVFVEAPQAVCLERRMQRDICERGRDKEEVLHRFHDHVWPMYLRHVLPTKADATVTVSGVQHLGQSLREILQHVPVAV